MEQKRPILYYYGAKYSGPDVDIITPFCVRTRAKIPKIIVVLKYMIGYGVEVQILAEKIAKTVTSGQRILSKKEIAEIADIADIHIDDQPQLIQSLPKENTEPLVEPLVILPSNLSSDPLDKPINSGSIVTHEDADGHHFAIVLEVEGNRAELLFLSSKRFGRRCREATKDELALTGFVYTKKTYLCLVTRSVSDLCSQGVNFPEHRVQDLIKEFIVDN
jgi:hypothetical protein